MLISHDEAGPLEPVADGTLLGDHNRSSILEFGFAHGPGAAGRAAAQRLDRHLELVAGLERLARPPIPDQRARRPAFEAPGLGGTVLLLGDEDDERVRAGELELLHDAIELDWIVVIEHRKRMVRQGGSTRSDQRSAYQECRQWPSHDVPPFFRFQNWPDAREAPQASVERECCRWGRTKSTGHCGCDACRWHHCCCLLP